MVHLILILTLPLHEKRTPVGVLFSLYKTLMKGYRTKRVGFIGDGASKLLAPSLF